MFDPSQNVEGARPWAGNIQQNQSRTTDSQHAKRFFASAGAAHLKAAPDHLGGERPAHGNIVRNDKNFQFLTRSHSAPTLRRRLTECMDEPTQRKDSLHIENLNTYFRVAP